MDLKISDQKNVTAEFAVEILKKNGTDITVDEAKIILDFMYTFGKLAVDQMIKLK